MYEAPFLALLGLIPYWLALGLVQWTTKRISPLQWLGAYPLEAIAIFIYSVFWLVVCATALFVERNVLSTWGAAVILFAIASVGSMHYQSQEIRKLWPKK